MALKHLLIVFLSVFTLASSQSISCNFTIPSSNYRCSLTIDNPEGIDGFNGIDGLHLSGMADADVTEVWFVAGTTTIIPRVICESFPNLQKLEIHEDVGIQSLTEGALSGCVKLRGIYLFNNPVTEIHQNFLRNNVNLEEVKLYHLQVTSIPEELFSTTPNMKWIFINSANYLTDEPVDLFKYTPLIEELGFEDNNLGVWRPEWTQTLSRLKRIYLIHNSLSEIPRNAINSAIIEVIAVSQNQIQVLDYFMFNNISSLFNLNVDHNPIEAVDFNLVDMATGLESIYALDWKCAGNKHFDEFEANRDAYMAELEPCFAAFDSRTLTFSTSGTELTFNSIRKEFINVQVQAASDAIIRFSSNPDGSGSNFEVKLGVDGNMNSCIYENGVQKTCTATPGLLSPIELRSFTIMWSGGFVYVMHGNPLMFNMLASPFKVRFYGVGTSGLSASWIIE